MLCEGGFMSSVHLPTLSAKGRHPVGLHSKRSRLVATVLGRFTSGLVARRLPNLDALFD